MLGQDLGSQLFATLQKSSLEALAPTGVPDKDGVLVTLTAVMGEDPHLPLTLCMQPLKTDEPLIKYV